MQDRCQQTITLADSLLAANPELESKIRKALLCNANDARRALVEVIRFMDLAATNDRGQFTPAHRVDLAWHELILFTRAYQQLCANEFGKFVHHHPGGLAHDNRSQFERTLRLYEQSFGPPPIDFWGHDLTTSKHRVASCGTCESDGE